MTSNYIDRLKTWPGCLVYLSSSSIDTTHIWQHQLVQNQNSIALFIIQMKKIEKVQLDEDLPTTRVFPTVWNKRVFHSNVQNYDYCSPNYYNVRPQTTLKFSMVRPIGLGDSFNLGHAAHVLKPVTSCCDVWRHVHIYSYETIFAHFLPFLRSSNFLLYFCGWQTFQKTSAVCFKTI